MLEVHASRAEPRPTHANLMDAEKRHHLSRVQGRRSRRAARWYVLSIHDKLMAVFWQDNARRSQGTYDALCAANLAFRAAEWRRPFTRFSKTAALNSERLLHAAATGRPLK